MSYHVLPGKVMSSDIAGKQLSAKTVEGSKVKVDATKGVMVDGAKVTAADIETSNGVIHVIDTVLLP
ncbi:MAG: fasciclin domain-containing protein [Pseudomonadota bacterium]